MSQQLTVIKTDTGWNLAYVSDHGAYFDEDFKTLDGLIDAVANEPMIEIES